MNKLLSESYERIVGGGFYPFYETYLRGRKTFQYHAEFERNQWLSSDEIHALQWTRLKAVLNHAYDTTDYYRASWNALDIHPDEIRSPADFARVPILEKDTVRKDLSRLVSNKFDLAKMVHGVSGGTTGDPLKFYYDRNSYQRRMAAAMRGDSWAGWSLCGGEFYIWGAPVLAGGGFKRFKGQVYHAAQRRYILNSFSMTPETIAAAARAYNRAKMKHVVGYTNAIYEFARQTKEQGIELHPPEGVVTSAEKLYPHQRELIEEVFGAKVFDRYGCREVMMIGAECGHHTGMHTTADNVCIEIARDGELCEPGQIGEVLLTDLHNYGMPLIRYRLGDIASWKGQDCPCGRALPLLKVVEGRMLDMITLPAGRVVPGEFFVYLFKDYSEIRQYHVIQEEPDLLRLRIGLHKTLLPEILCTFEESVRRVVGPDVSVQWEIGTDIVIEKTRKFRPVMSKVTKTLTVSDRGEECLHALTS